MSVKNRTCGFPPMVSPGGTGVTGGSAVGTGRFARITALTSSMTSSGDCGKNSSFNCARLFSSFPRGRFPARRKGPWGVFDRSLQCKGSSSSRGPDPRWFQAPVH
ncbi:MAG: hypothetical protein MZV64_17410 [Ignavibacteriales bacterium]|nr:hypothetical protein [Ignavibacteriales bacterium]